MKVAPALPSHTELADYAAQIGRLAALCLRLEVQTFPKPGLVSHADTGSHNDMNAELLYRSAAALRPYFRDLTLAGATGAGIDRLRQIGVAAEQAMLAATRGINTHRGAIFGIGLLCAAAGTRTARGLSTPLGSLIAELWGDAILSGPPPVHSHGALAAQRHGAGGARAEAASGFRSVYEIALPALQAGRMIAPHDEEAARVQACMMLIAHVIDTNLLHRGGSDGLTFAQQSATAFLANGGVAQPGWRAAATEIHRAFVARNLSPGGCADLLAMALFVDRLEAS